MFLGYESETLMAGQRLANILFDEVRLTQAMPFSNGHVHVQSTQHE